LKSWLGNWGGGGKKLSPGQILCEYGKWKVFRAGEELWARRRGREGHRKVSTGRKVQLGGSNLMARRGGDFPRRAKCLLFERDKELEPVA